MSWLLLWSLVPPEESPLRLTYPAVARHLCIILSAPHPHRNPHSVLTTCSWFQWRCLPPGLCHLQSWRLVPFLLSMFRSPHVWWAWQFTFFLCGPCPNNPVTWQLLWSVIDLLLILTSLACVHNRRTATGCDWNRVDTQRRRLLWVMPHMLPDQDY